MTSNAFHDLKPLEFERFVARLWQERGWETTVTPAQQDGGIDVVATKTTPYAEKQLIQAKHYQDGNSVSAPEIQQYAGLKHQHPDADSVVIVTSGEFTDPARETAEQANVKLVSGTQLADLAADNDLLKTTPTQTPAPSLPDVSGVSEVASREVADLVRDVGMILIALYIAYTLYSAGLLGF